MIDYEKLLEILKMLAKATEINDDLICNLAIKSDRGKFYLQLFDGRRDDFLLKVDDYTQGIYDKLKELTKSQPKFKVGEILHAVISGKVLRLEVDEITYCDVDKKFIYGGWEFEKDNHYIRGEESDLYPTKNEAIDAQIKYWESQRGD